MPLQATAESAWIRVPTPRRRVNATPRCAKCVTFISLESALDAAQAQRSQEAFGTVRSLSFSVACRRLWLTQKALGLNRGKASR